MYGPQTPRPQQVGQVGAYQPVAQPTPQQVGKSDFQRILEEKTAAAGGGVSFSSHAIKRLEQRSIALSADDVSRLTGALDRAATKGARESLVLLDDLALVVSVTNRKVITAMDREHMKENVVTNIDSAVIA
jgi:flagellar operon protein